MPKQSCITPDLCNYTSCVGRCLQDEPPPPPDPVELARADARNFGTGFYRRYPNGHIEHIPADQVTICTRPNTQED